MTFLEFLSKVLSVIPLFLLGLFLNRRHLIRPETVTDLKTLADLDIDISEALPYLNAIMPGANYQRATNTLLARKAHIN